MKKNFKDVSINWNFLFELLFSMIHMADILWPLHRVMLHSDHIYFEWSINRGVFTRLRCCGHCWIIVLLWPFTTNRFKSRTKMENFIRFLTITTYIDRFALIKIQFRKKSPDSRFQWQIYWLKWSTHESFFMKMRHLLSWFFTILIHAIRKIMSTNVMCSRWVPFGSMKVVSVGELLLSFA